MDCINCIFWNALEKAACCFFYKGTAFQNQQERQQDNQELEAHWTWFPWSVGWYLLPDLWNLPFIAMQCSRASATSDMVVDVNDKWCTSNCMSWQAHGVVLCWLGSRFQKPVMLLISLSEKCNSMLIFYVISYHFCSFIGNYANSMQNLCKNYASPTNSFICLMHNSCKKMLDLCKIYAIYIHIIARLMQMINATFVQD